MTLRIEPVPVADPVARAVLRSYLAEMVERYQGRPSTPAEVDTADAENPSDDIAPPNGVFLLARRGDEVAGCVGVRFGPGRYSELTRLFVAPGGRRQGTGARLLAEAEACALRAGARIIRLDTRHDLVEARALYAKHGYREVPAYSAGPYAEHWFAKELSEVD